MTAKKQAKPPKFRSRLAEAIHETAADLHRAGVVDGATMRQFDASCLMVVDELTSSPRSAANRRDAPDQ
jgi:putative transcriptional regulator